MFRTANSAVYRRAAQGRTTRHRASDCSQRRQSRGLEQFFFNIRDMVGLSILDLAGANQENINFLTNLGHKVYSQDLVRSLDEAFGPDPAEQTNVEPYRLFSAHQFRLPPGHISTACCSGIRCSSWARRC